MLKVRVVCFVLVAVGATFAQLSAAPKSVRVAHVRFQAATSADNVLAASVADVVANPEVCCGRSSSRVDVVAAADLRNLVGIASKLQGRHVLGDGRPYVLSATFFSARPTLGQMPAANVILTFLQGDHAMLMLWNSHLYVVYGADYTETVYNGVDSGNSVVDTVDTLQLFDPATGAHTTFQRAKDNWDQVQGLGTLTVGPSSS
jgi:hypothetical protein